MNWKQITKQQQKKVIMDLIIIFPYNYGNNIYNF